MGSTDGQSQNSDREVESSTENRLNDTVITSLVPAWNGTYQGKHSVNYINVYPARIPLKLI